MDKARNKVLTKGVSKMVWCMKTGGIGLSRERLSLYSSVL
jgi:hypothetical protein